MSIEKINKKRHNDESIEAGGVMLYSQIGGMVMLSLRIAEMRRGKDLKQAEIAKLLNISQQTYSSYETGRRQMDYANLCLLADYFEVSTDYLLGRKEAMPSYLSGEERLLIEQYRMLDKNGRDSVNNCAAFECSRSPKIKKEQAI